MNILTFTFFLQLAINTCHGASHLHDICKEFVQPEQTKVLLETFCTDGTIIGRCCVNKSNTTIGVDWSSCKMKKLPALTEADKSHLKWVSLFGNDNVNIEKSDWRNYRDLSTLILPTEKNCTESFNKTEVKNNLKICSSQRKGCTPGVTCPENSHCAPDGPSLSMCMCDDGWHSYRCLKKDGFPAIQWIAGFSVSTVIICVSLHIAQKKSIANINSA